MIEEQLLSKVKNLAINTISSATEILKTVITIQLEHAKTKQEKAACEALLSKMESGERLYQVVIPNKDIKDFLMYVNLSDISKKNYIVNDLKNDDAKVIWYPESLLEKFQQANTMYIANKGLINEISSDLFLLQNENNDIQTFSNLSPVELELFRKHSVCSNLIYSAIQEKDNTITLLTNAKSSEKTKSILRNISWDLTGEQGPYVRKQVEYRIKNRKQINIAIEEAKQDYFIVSPINNKQYLKITAEGYSIYKNDKEVFKKLRNESDFKNSITNEIKKIKESVCLTQSEFSIRTPENIKEKGSFFSFNYSSSPDEEISNLNNILSSSESKLQVKNHLQESQYYFENTYKEEIVKSKDKTLNEKLKEIKLNKQQSITEEKEMQRG